MITKDEAHSLAQVPATIRELDKLIREQAELGHFNCNTFRPQLHAKVIGTLKRAGFSISNIKNEVHIGWG